MSSGDKLQIFLDNVLTPASDETLQLISEQNELMRRITKLLEPSANQNVSGQQRVEASISSIPTTSVNHNLTFMGGALNNTIPPPEHYFVLGSRQAYIALRNNLTFS
jgi:hypothetical protein